MNIPNNIHSNLQQMSASTQENINELVQMLQNPKHSNRNTQQQQQSMFIASHNSIPSSLQETKINALKVNILETDDNQSMTNLHPAYQQPPKNQSTSDLRRSDEHNLSLKPSLHQQSHNNRYQNSVDYTYSHRQADPTALMMQKLLEMEHRLKYAENHIRIQDEQLRLKNQEKDNAKAIEDSVYEELTQRNQFLEKRIQQLEQQMMQVEVTINHSMPQQVQKAIDKASNHIEAYKMDMDDHLQQYHTQQNSKLIELKDHLECQLLKLNKEQLTKIEQHKDETEKQMNEMCSMIEEMAKMVKGVEWQVNQKRQETEQILLNLANMQRRIDEHQRLIQNEVGQLKKRQYQLFQLYNTTLEPNENNDKFNINDLEQSLKRGEMKSLGETLDLEQTGKFIVDNKNLNKSGTESFGIGEMSKAQQKIKVEIFKENSNMTGKTENRRY